MNRILNFLSRFNIQQSLVWGLLIAALAALLAFGSVSLIASQFHTTMLSATGWAIAGAAYVLLLGVGLGCEAWVKAAGREPPSWLPKANRIMIGGSLLMALSVVCWQFMWSMGASGAHSQGFWMVGSTVLVMGLLIGFGLGAKALGQSLGFEFLPGTGLVVVVVLNAFVALEVNTRGSYTDQAIEGELFYAYRTASCGPEAGNLVPIPLSAWDLTVHRVNLFQTVYVDRVGNCDAYQLEYSDRNQRAWVTTWNQQAQADVAALESYTGMIILGGLGVIVTVVLLAGWWRGKWSLGSVAFVAVSFAFLAICASCGGMLISDMLGLNIADHAEDMSRRVSGAPAKFYQPFQIEPQGSVRIGSPPGSGSVYVCQCGPTHRQIWLEANWHADAQYVSGQYAMAPQGCGGAWNVSDGNVYRVHNRAGDLSPVMKVMTHGETWTCPDGTVLTAR